MDVDAALAAGATLVGAAFCLSTLDRWALRRRAHELAWTVAMALFVVGAGALWWAQARGWSAASFRVFYLAGAVLNVAWLGLGTVYLLGGVAWGHRVRAALVFLSGCAAGVVLASPLRVPIGGDELPKGADVFGPAPRVFAAVGSAVPAAVILAGALWSAWRVSRGRPPALARAAGRAGAAPARLAAGNGLIAVGTVILSASGSLAGRLGEVRAFSVTLLVGISVLFAGFLVATATPGASRGSRPSRFRPGAGRGANVGA